MLMAMLGLVSSVVRKVGWAIVIITWGSNERLSGAAMGYRLYVKYFVFMVMLFIHSGCWQDGLIWVQVRWVVQCLVLPRY